MGSSSSTMSKRLSSRAASATRAACPPESPVIAASGPTSRPRSASTGGIRSSRSAAPEAIQRSNATEYASSEPGAPVPSASAVDSMSAVAWPQPVRRAM